MINIITIIGARPQFIKAAALSREITNHPELSEKIIHTGQHFDQNMSDIFFEEMQIPKPHFELHIHGLSHGAMTGQMMEAIEKILIQEKPDLVLVYGDTNSTLAGALAAKKLHIKVAHVEAGLRSFNSNMPEELNRILTDRISDLLFCPTQQAIDNLKSEGFDHFNSQIVRTGDIMLDAANFYRDKAMASTILEQLNIVTKPFLLATIHRADNTDNPENLKSIMDGLNEIAKKQTVVIPLHPRTKAALEKANITCNVQIIGPVGYFDMLKLLTSCNMVVTDSGGLQKEAHFFHKFCITTRDETEWTELISNQVNVLTGANDAKINEAFETLIQRSYPEKINLYGDGNCATLICESIIKHCSK